MNVCRDYAWAAWHNSNNISDVSCLRGSRTRWWQSTTELSFASGMERDSRVKCENSRARGQYTSVMRHEDP